MMVNDLIGDTCKWKEDDGFYATECEHGFYFNDDGIDENNFIYCPYCGKRIQEHNEE